MAAVDYDPFVGNPGESIVPHLPSTEDLGGVGLINDPADPPDPETMPEANALNSRAYAAAALARTTPAMVISIAFNAGDPYVYGVTFTNATLDSGDIELTDNGTGDTSIEWDSDVFPVVSGVRPHGLTINDDVTIDEMRAVPITNGVRVKTLASSSGVDAAFTVVVQGQ